MGDPLLINISHLLTGQRDKFLTDSVSDNEKRVLPDPETALFLSLISHQEDSPQKRMDKDYTVLPKYPATHRSRDCAEELQDHK